VTRLETLFSTNIITQSREFTVSHNVESESAERPMSPLLEGAEGYLPAFGCAQIKATEG
jgi:hypothetical protein